MPRMQRVNSSQEAAESTLNAPNSSRSLPSGCHLGNASVGRIDDERSLTRELVAHIEPVSGRVDADSGVFGLEHLAEEALGPSGLRGDALTVFVRSQEQALAVFLRPLGRHVERVVAGERPLKIRSLPTASLGPCRCSRRPIPPPESGRTAAGRWHPSTPTRCRKVPATDGMIGSSVPLLTHLLLELAVGVNVGNPGGVMQRGGTRRLC